MVLTKIWWYSNKTHKNNIWLKKLDYNNSTNKHFKAPSLI